MDHHAQRADQSTDHSSSSDITRREAVKNNLTDMMSPEAVTPSRPEVNPSRVLVTGSNVTLYNGNPSFVVSPPHSNEASRLHTVSETPLHEEIGLQEPNRIYERHMLTRVRGYPLWLPEGDLNTLVEKRRVGISIGDVGMVTSDGYFSYLFNILLPADDPRQPAQLPEGFSPVKALSPSGVSRVKKYKDNSALTSLSVRKVPELVADDATRTEQKFELSSSEGAVLALPDGAQSYDLREDVVFWTSHKRANLRHWYKYAIGTLGCDVRNGDIRLITGCDKTTFWGVAVAEHPSFGPEKCWLRFRSSETTNSRSEVHAWDYAGVVTSRTGPSQDEIRQLDWDMTTYRTNEPNQCVCVRSLTRTLPKDEWSKISEEFGLEQSMDGNDTGTSANPSGSTSSSFFNNVTSTGSSGGKFVQDEKPHQRLYTNYHPADLVNQMLLALSPDAKAASCIDSNWCYYLQPMEPSYVESFPLTSVISKFDATYMLCIVFLGAEVENVEGCVQLKARPSDAEPGNPVWKKLCSIHAQRDQGGLPNNSYTSNFLVADLLPIFDAFIKFFLGIQALKDSGHQCLLDDFNCWTWPFFRDAFCLLDPIVTLDWLVLHDSLVVYTYSPATSSTEPQSLSDPRHSAFATISESYRSFRLTGNVQDLETTTNTLRNFPVGTMRPASPILFTPLEYGYLPFYTSPPDLTALYPFSYDGSTAGTQFDVFNSYSDTVASTSSNSETTFPPEPYYNTTPTEGSNERKRKRTFRNVRSRKRARAGTPEDVPEQKQESTSRATPPSRSRVRDSPTL